MNIPAVAEKIVHAVKNYPKIEKEYSCHGDPHSYMTTDWDALEITIQELLDKEI